MSDDDPRPDNVVDIRQAMEDAQPAVMDEQDFGAIDDAPPVGNSAAPSQRTGTDNLPPQRLRLQGDIRGWPVKALGVKGSMYYYLDELNQLRELSAKEHSKNNIASLFGRQLGKVYEYYPRAKMEDGEWIVTGWQAEKVVEDLQVACAKRGVWDPKDRVRGAGAWCGEDDELILHCGDKIILIPQYDEDGNRVADGWEESVILKPDVIGRSVYPAAPAGPMPHMDRQIAGSDGPAQAVLDILNTWNWKRHDLDAYMLFSWICAAYLGGALEWRPHCWLGGGAGTGKSSLQRLIDNLLNDMCLSITDPTAAAIWQTLGSASLPVKIDEGEAEEDDRAIQNVIKLARHASSGGKVTRGGQDHKSHEFLIRSPFLYSSVLIPALKGTDKSRIAVLDLGDLLNSEPPNTSPKRMKDLGRRIFRRVVDGWVRLPQALEQYRAALQKEGLDSRACDQYGTLLAASDLALYDGHVPPERAADWAAQVKASDIVSWGDTDKDEDEFIRHLLTSTIDPWRSGSRQTVAELIEKAWGRQPGEFPDKDAQRALGMHGMKIGQLKEVGIGMDEPWFLMIANKHRGLDELFKDTRWKKGVWRQPALRLPNAFAPKAAVYIGGATTKVAAVALDSVMPSGMETTSERGEAARTQNPPNPDPEEFL